MDTRDGVWRIIRLQDVVWMLLCLFLAIFGPDRSEYTIGTLIGIGIMQVVQPRVRYFQTRWGPALSFAISLALWYILMGWTDGIESSYYWILLLPVIAVATSSNLFGTALAALAGCGAYISFIKFLRPEQYIPAQEWKFVVLRAAIFPVVGYLAHELAEASRTAARKAEAAAEQLSEANLRLQEAQAAVRRSERLAALGQLSAGLAHELRNPLGTVKASAELLAKSVEGNNEVAREMAGFISSEVDRTNALVTRFLDFARPLAVQLEQTDLAQVHRPGSRRDRPTRSAIRHYHLQELFTRHPALPLRSSIDRAGNIQFAAQRRSSQPHRGKHHGKDSPAGRNSGGGRDRPRLRNRTEASGKHFQSVFHH